MEIEIKGLQPEYKKSILQAIIMQQYFYEGKLEEEANMLYLQLDEKWFSVCIDAGVIFWDQKKEKPKDWNQNENRFEYKMKNIMEPFEKEEIKINNITYYCDTNNFNVKFFLSNKTNVELYNQNDNTKYLVTEE